MFKIKDSILLNLIAQPTVRGCSAQHSHSLAYLPQNTHFLHNELVLAYLRLHCSPVSPLSRPSGRYYQTEHKSDFLFSPSLLREAVFLSRNLVQPSAFPLAARHWQMAARRTHWRAIAPTDTVNPLWIRKVWHDVPGKDTLGYIHNCAQLTPPGHIDSINAHCWYIILWFYWAAMLKCKCRMNDQMIHTCVCYSLSGYDWNVIAWTHAAILWNLPSEFIDDILCLSHLSLPISHLGGERKWDK